MLTHILSSTDSMFNEALAQMRDVTIQKDSMRFRSNLEKVGYMFAYEISKALEYEDKEVHTPLGIANGRVMKDTVVLGTILRAGLPMHTGMLRMFDNAENAFVAAYRKYGRDYKFTIELEYLSCPNLEGKVLVIADPMLATGSSMFLTYNELIKKGTPKYCHIATLIASREGYEYICRKMGHLNVTLWVGAIDEELTTKSYIVPGLGDAGDLAFKEK